MSTPSRRFFSCGLCLCSLAAASAGACASSANLAPQLVVASAASAAETPANAVETGAAEPAAGEPPVVIVLREGDKPTGGDDLPVSGLGIAVTDGNGQPAFTGFLDDGANGDGFVWRDGALVWRASEVPGNMPAAASPLMGAGDSGQFVFQTVVDGLDAIWSHHGLLLQKKQAAPGMDDGATIEISRFTTMTPAGTAYWISEFRDGRGAPGLGRVLYRSPDGKPETTEVVLRSDDLIEGMPIDRPYGLDLNYQVSDNDQHLVQVMQLETGSHSDDGVLYVDGGIALREGDTAGEEEIWERFSRVAINNSGDYLVAAITDAENTRDAVIAYNGNVVLREGDRVAGLRLSSQAAVLALSIDNSGRAVHMWSVGGFGPEHILFACDASQLEDSILLLSTTKPLDFGPLDHRVGIDRFNNTGHGQALWLADNDRLFVELDLKDGSDPPDTEPKQAILSVALPDCPLEQEMSDDDEAPAEDRATEAEGAGEFTAGL